MKGEGKVVEKIAGVTQCTCFPNNRRCGHGQGEGDQVAIAETHEENREACETDGWKKRGGEKILPLIPRKEGKYETR